MALCLQELIKSSFKPLTCLLAPWRGMRTSWLHLEKTLTLWRCLYSQNADFIGWCLRIWIQKQSCCSNLTWLLHLILLDHQPPYSCALMPVLPDSHCAGAGKLWNTQGCYSLKKYTDCSSEVIQELLIMCNSWCLTHWRLTPWDSCCASITSHPAAVYPVELCSKNKLTAFCKEHDALPGRTIN